MTTDSEALICDCPAKNMPFGRCCKLEPLTALRAAFESTVSEWGGGHVPQQGRGLRHHINKRRSFTNPLTFLTRHTATHTDNNIGIRLFE